MNRQKGLIISVFLAFLMVSSVNAYEIDFYISGNDASPTSAIVPSFLNNEDCNIVINPYMTFTDSDATTETTLRGYSPHNNLILIAEKEFTSNQTCFYFGPVNSSLKTGNNTLDSKTTLTHNADSLTNYLHTKLSCKVDNDLYFNVTYENGELDSSDYVPNMYYKSTVKNCVLVVPYTVDEFTPYLDNSKFGVCKGVSVQPLAPPITQGGAGDDKCVGMMYYFPFKTGETGDFIYDLDCDNCFETLHALSNYDRQWIVYPQNDNSDITVLAASTQAEGKTTLLKNTDYVLAYFESATDLDNSENVILSEPDKANYDIYAYEADYSDCEEWSECLNGTRRRLCNDVGGVDPPKYFYEDCDLIVLENATLGFEEFVREDDIYKCVPATGLFGCYYAINQTYRDTPLNWTIGENSELKRDFLKMTEEWKAEGSRSLKMWYIPPKDGEVIDADTCGNSTVGSAPYVTRNISNTSFSIGYNVTFPGENMILSFNVKGCENQVLQHSDYGGLIWSNPINDSPIYIIPPCMYERCYAGSCLGVPDSRYIVNLIDTVTGNSVFQTPFFDSASINMADTIKLPLDNLGIVAGRTYTLVLSIYPENLNDNSGNCIYFDNIRYQRTEISLFNDVLNGECKTQCLGKDLYEATYSQNGLCSVRVIEYGCASDEIKDALESGKGYCENNKTLIRLNPKTKLPEEINCDYLCEDGQCIAEPDEDETTDAELKDSSSILSYLGIDLGIFNFYFSVIMIATYILLGLCGVMVYLTEKMEMGLASFIVMTVLYSFGGIYPLWVGLSIAVGVSALFAYLWSKAGG